LSDARSLPIPQLMRKGNVCSQMVCMTGEAGIGKTALVDAFVFTIIEDP
jgi:hypothetical protein